MGNILSSGPVQLPVDPSKLTTKELLNGGRPTPKPQAAAVGINGTRMANPAIWARLKDAAGTTGKLAINGLLRLGGAQVAFNPNAPAANRVEGGLMATFPLIGSAFAALKGAYNSGDYGGMNAIAGVDLTKPIPKGYAFDNSLSTNPDSPTIVKSEKTQPPKSVVENPNDDWADPIAGRGPKGNEVGSDADLNTPGLQGSGAPGANPYKPGSQEHGMFIWAQKHKGMAQDVLDKVEKRGLKQAGYTSIREALGQTPKNPYTDGVGVKIGDKDISEIYSPTIDLKGEFMDIPADYKTDYNINPGDFLNGKIEMLTTSASGFQQPNFKGLSEPIGSDSPEKPQPVQDFQNANTNPAEVVPTTYHPLNIKPSPEAEAANAEYGAMKFQFDPAKNMMVRVK